MNDDYDTRRNAYLDAKDQRDSLARLVADELLFRGARLEAFTDMYRESREAFQTARVAYLGERAA